MLTIRDCVASCRVVTHTSRLQNVQKLQIHWLLCFGESSTKAGNWANWSRQDKSCGNKLIVGLISTNTCQLNHSVSQDFKKPILLLLRLGQPHLAQNVCRPTHPQREFKNSILPISSRTFYSRIS